MTNEAQRGNAPAASAPAALPPPRHKGLRVLGAIAAAVIFGIAVRALIGILAKYRWQDIQTAFQNLPYEHVLMAIGFTAASFAVLTLYDMLALRYAGRPLPYHRSMLVSLVACALGNSVSPGFISGGAVRYRMYSTEGLTGLEIAKVITFCSMMTGLGVMVFGGLGLILSPDLVASVNNLSPAFVRPIGLLMLAPAVALIASSLAHKSVWRFRRHEFQLPSPRFAVGQILLPLTDDVLAGAVLYVLLPPDSLSFTEFAGVYSVAVALGFISYVPGGLGVFESLFLVLTASRIPGDQAIAALMGYRVIYYLVPLGLGMAALGIYESMPRRSAAPKNKKNLATDLAD